MLTDAIDNIPLRHERVSGAGVDLHVAVAGEGPPIVLLHGFPENWRSWRHQIAPLARAGFSVWAPDLRGYNLSGKPANRRAYHLRHLIADVAAIVRATGFPRAHIGGHDWGGVIAWTFAGAIPELVDRLVIFNAPHLEIYLRAAWRPPQLLRSWYVAFFLLPVLPELALSAWNFRAVRRMFRRMPARPHAFSDDDIDRYVAALAMPGALTAALNYYRANSTPDTILLAGSARVGAEVLVLWGDRDPALDPVVLTGLDAVAPRLQIVRFPDVGHWIQNEAPEEVNPLLTAFLRAPAAGL